jgi:hyaluronate lyase
MHLINHDKSLQARKSWFCLSDSVVALGAGISGSDGYPVETVVENRNLHADGEAALLVDGVDQPVSQGWTDSFNEPRWAHLEGVGGYLFPSGGRLRGLRAERTGSWREINTGNDTAGSTTQITRRYVSLVFEHGTDPGAGGYSYIMLPGATTARTAELAVDSGIRVLANTSTVQAIRSARDKLTLVNFWSAGEVDKIAASGPASVVIGRSGSSIGVAVSDPSRTQQTVRITVADRFGRVQAADETVTVIATGNQLVLDVAVGGSRGATHSATFSRG